MAHTIITKNSSTAGAVPSAGSLTKGELAVNVTDRRLYTKDNSGSVVELGSGTSIIYRDNFTGDGSTVAFTLPRTPLNEELVDIYCDGVYQGKDTFSISGAVITFDEAPLSGASIEVMTFQSSPIGETAANYVSYTPAGTGAVATTVQSKLRETVSVKDFGAVGDGVTDDTAAIQAAIAASLNVYFPSGIYLTTGITPRYGQTLRGASRYNTYIKSTTNAPIISFGGTTSGGLNVGFVLLEDLRIQGSLSAGSLQHGISVVPQQSFITLKRVHIVQCGGDGIRFEGTVTFAGNDQWHIEDTKIEQSVGYGVNVLTQLATSVFVNVETYANSTGGWNLNSASGLISGNVWIRCIDRWNENTSFAVVNGVNIAANVSNCTWQNCWGESNGNKNYPDTNRVSAWAKITTGGNANLRFIAPKCTVQSRGIWVTNSTKGVTIDNYSSELMSGFRSSADIIVDPGSVATITNPTSTGTLIVAAVDGKSKILFQGITCPTGTTRVFRGAVYDAEDGTKTRVLTGGATAGTYGGGTWAGSSGTNTITASTSHSLRIGDHVQIPGAGTAGATLHAYITSMNATDLVATLDRNLQTTVTVSAMVNGASELSVGSFTPVVFGASVNGVGTYTAQAGEYVVDDNLNCTYRFNAAWTAHTGSGTLIVNMPFASTAEQTTNPLFAANYTYGAGNIPVLLAGGGLSYAQGRTMSDGGAGAALALDTAASILATVRFKAVLLC